MISEIITPLSYHHKETFKEKHLACFLTKRSVISLAKKEKIHVDILKPSVFIMVSEHTLIPTQ